MPANIPVGKLETPGRKPEPARPADTRKTPTHAPPVLPPTVLSMAAAPVQIAASAAIDVELIPIPMPQSGFRAESRGLLELNRRDALMLVAGGVLVVAAIAAGWGLFRLLHREPPPETQQVVPGQGAGYIEG